MEILLRLINPLFPGSYKFRAGMSDLWQMQRINSPPIFRERLEPTERMATLEIPDLPDSPGTEVTPALLDLTETKVLLVTRVPLELMASLVIRVLVGQLE